MTDVVTDLGSIARTDWSDEYVRRYQDATYGAAHQREYLRLRSETIAALVDECRRPGHAPRVLEVACGPGLSLDYLSRRSEDVRLAGIDMSRDMLRLAAANVHATARRPELAQASARLLPFRDESFDAVYATRFIHLFRNKASLVEELKRVTRSGGLVIIEFYGRPFHLVRYVTRYLTRRSRVPLSDYLYHYPSLAEVRRVMGPRARFIPLRFGGERLLRKGLSESRLRRLLDGAWNTPLRAGLAEYFAVIRRT